MLVCWHGFLPALRFFSASTAFFFCQHCVGANTTSVLALGLFCYGLGSYGLYSYGLYSYGLCSYGKYSYGLDARLRLLCSFALRLLRSRCITFETFT